MKVKELLSRQSQNKNLAVCYSNKQLTYEQWNLSSEQLANKIRKFTNEESKTIGVFLPNSINYAIAYFGVLYCDKIIIPIGVQTKEKELISTMRYCEIDFLITHTKYRELFENVNELYDYKFGIFYIDTGEYVEYGEKKNNIEKTEPINNLDTKKGDEVVIMLHTSGTSSKPKRVMLTNKSLLANVKSNVESLNLTEQDRVCIALPMYFGYSNTAQFLSHIYVGGSMYILDNIFTPHAFLKLVQEYRITNFTAVPTMLILLLEYRHSAKYDYSSLRFICFGGGVVSKEILRRIIEDYKGISFIHTYGQTECSPRLTALLPPYTLTKLGSVGKAIPGVTIAVIDDEGRILEAGKEGEIIAKGDNIMRGYFKRPDETSNVLQNGYIHTGDIGYFDDEGFLYISGRKKNMVVVGGLNVYPEEIEEIIREFSGVKDVYVYGIEDPMMGEVVAAQVVMDREEQITELKKYCNKELPKYKNPRIITLVSKIEKTYNGKTRRVKG